MMQTRSVASSALVLEPFLRPRRLALVGASTNPGSISARPARFLRRLGYAGEVAVIHPHASEVMGFDAVPSLSDLDVAPDVAMVLVSAPGVVGVLEDCLRIGTRAAVVIASGFEGELGTARRHELRLFLSANPEMRIIGPNCNGVLSVASRTALCFSSVLVDEDPILGRVSLVTQSGAIGNGLLLALQRRGVGLAHLFSTGNESSIGAIELSAKLLDEDTDAVGLFLEGLTDAQFLPLLADNIARTGKPVVALRAPQSASSKAAAYAHTGRLIGDDYVGRQALIQSGVTLVDSMEELTDAMAVLSAFSIRPLKQPTRVGVLTVSGGLGVFAAEAVSREPTLKLAEFDDDLRIRLRTIMPPQLSVSNPLDLPVLGDTALFMGAMRAMRESRCCDVVVVVASSLAHDYDQLATSCGPGGAPVVITHLSPEERFTPRQAHQLLIHEVLGVQTVGSAAGALGLWAAPREDTGSPSDPGPPPLSEEGWVAVGSPSAPDSSLTISGSRVLGIVNSLEYLSETLEGHVPLTRTVSSFADVKAVAPPSGNEFALKAEGSFLTHRTEYGAVITGLSLSRPEEVSRAFTSVAAVCAEHGDSVVLQEMANVGIEVLLSVTRDQEIGPTVLARSGGVLVDLVDETVALIGRRGGWRTTLEQSRSLGPLLTGFRGSAPGDIEAFLDLADDLRCKMQHDSRIKLIECNPVLVHKKGEGVSVVDVVMVMDA